MTGLDRLCMHCLKRLQQPRGCIVHYFCKSTITSSTMHWTHVFHIFHEATIEKNGHFDACSDAIIVYLYSFRVQQLICKYKIAQKAQFIKTYELFERGWSECDLV